MNMQSRMPGQLSGQVPDQARMAEGQNGNVLQPAGMHNFVGSAGFGVVAGGNQNNGMSKEYLRIHQYIQNKIRIFLQRMQPSVSEAKLIEAAKRFEDALKKMAKSKEEYFDLRTLEARLVHLFRQFSQRANPSRAVATTIPTPGVSSGGSQTFTTTGAVDTAMSTSDRCNKLAGQNLKAGSLLLTNGIRGGKSNRSDGSLFDGCQQVSAGFPIGSGANISAVGAQRMTGQMIPTPGFNNAHNNLQSRMKEETSGDGGRVSAVESVVATPSQLDRQHPASPNSHIRHKLGNQSGGSFGSSFGMKSSGMMNSPQNAGLGMNRNNLRLANEPRTSEGFLCSTHLSTSVKPSQQPVDQLQHSGRHGYAMSNSDSFEYGNFYGLVTSSGPMADTQDVNAMSLNPMLRVNASFPNNQPNMHRMQQVPLLKPEAIDQYENTSFKSSFTFGENMDQVHQQRLPQQLQQQSYQFLHQEQFSRPLRHDHNQHQQHVLIEDAYVQSQPASDLVVQVKHEAGLNHCDEVQAHNQFQPSLQQNQYEQNSVDDHCFIAQCASVSSSQHNVPPLVPPHSLQMQQVSHGQGLPLEPRNDLSNLSVGVQSVPVPDQWHPQSLNCTQISGKNNVEREHVQANLCQRIRGQHEALDDGLSTRTPMISQSIALRSSTVTLNCSGSKFTTSKPVKEDTDPKYEHQSRFLALLLHARSCSAPEGECIKDCAKAKDLLKHVDNCNGQDCKSQRCLPTRKLLDHWKHCRDEECPVCARVRNFIEKQKAKSALRKPNSGLPSLSPGHSKPYDSTHASARRASEVSSDAEDLQPSLKRLKVEPPSRCVASDTGSVAASVSAVVEAHSLPNLREEDIQKSDICTTAKSEIMHTEMEVSDTSPQVDTDIIEKNDVAEDASKERHIDKHSMVDEPVPLSKQEELKRENETNPPKDENVTQPSEIVSESKSSKSKVKGVSLIELFTPQQVREHIHGLRQWVGQSKTKAEKNKAMERSMTENSCQLCAIERLAFEPAPMYCMPCGARIKRNAMHYTVAAGETRHYVCIPCYNEARGDTVVIDGASIPKARFEKRKNDEEIEEWWVQCDKCESWQHQICALFNGRRNHGQAEYTCPNCYIEEVERGERKPLPQSTVLGAKDLPSTILSNHIEQRLFKKLRQERQERARLQGKSYDEVPGAESLVVRVVSSVDKTLEVKPCFLDLFREENYPSEFPYKSKAILLFQKIEGVEVCLFGMYVQEFGTDSALPNQRRVYLSYLDSVKYFRPEVRTVTGEALRTFVYHEILIGYLEYCKKRGFTSCYIWACPPLKGEDYILYCHPEIQKTPKTDKLREWYLAMLRKASKENVAVECTNFYDHFFVQSGECRAKVTAARLPYFDGDYWPGAAEDLIRQMSQEDDGQRSNKKGTTKKIISKRALKAAGRSDLSVNASKDLLLMHKLGETISPMKEDFIMVHLQHCCKHCCVLMVSGNRWVCDKCKNFQICDKCYEVEQNREARDRHPINQKENHTLHPVAITEVPTDTTDRDGILESEFFDTRQAFLSLCQGNHYQYDTLRRAKHSSMMVLHHLHNPSAPAFVTPCAACQQDIETGQGWRCEVCPDFDVCNACYLRGINHPHNLINHPSATEPESRTNKAKQTPIQLLRKLLVHALGCRSAQCKYPYCMKVKRLFRHAAICQSRASGGCGLCKRMWEILHIHARNCRDSQCRVPRCSDLRARFSRLQQQSDSRRRAAVMEMMRQRAAEVSNG